MDMLGIRIGHGLKASAHAVQYHKMGSRTKMAVNGAIKTLILLDRKSNPHHSASYSIAFLKFYSRPSSPDTNPQEKDPVPYDGRAERRRILFFKGEGKEGSQAV